MKLWQKIVAGGIPLLALRSRIVILCYHTVSWEFPGEMSPAIFERHIKLMLARGYKFISATDYGRWLDGQLRLPRKAALMTFDDGFCSQLSNAVPILQRYAIPAINFIVHDKIAGQYDWQGVPEQLHEPLMNDDEIKIWLERGYDIGSHTLSHPRLAQLSREQKQKEIIASKELLERRFGVSIDWLCYPYGDFDAECEHIARAAGYRAALACFARTHTLVISRYAIRRILVYPQWSDKKFLYKISRRFDFVALVNLTLARLKRRG